MKTKKKEMSMYMGGGKNKPMNMYKGKVYEEGGLLAALMKDPKQRAAAKKMLGSMEKGGMMYGEKGMKVKKYQEGGMNATGETLDKRKPKEEVRERRFPLTSGVDTELPTKEEYFEGLRELNQRMKSSMKDYRATGRPYSPTQRREQAAPDVKTPTQLQGGTRPNVELLKEEIKLYKKRGYKK